MTGRYQSLPFGGPDRRPGPPVERVTTTNARELNRPVIGVVTRDGTALVIKFSRAGHLPFINAVKEIRGWRWNQTDAVPGTATTPAVPAGGYWTVHVGHIRQVRAAAAKHGWTMSPSVQSLPDMDPREVPMLVTVEGEQLVIDGPWREDISKILTSSDGRLDGRSGKWRLPLEGCVDVVLDMRKVAKVRFVGNATELTDRIDQASYMLALSRQLDPTNGWQLAPKIRRDPGFRTFQHSGIEYGWRSQRMFNWATMGGGKTYITAATLEQLDWTTAGEGRAWAEDFLQSTLTRAGAAIDMPPTESPFPVLVVPPAGLKTNWFREFAAVNPDRKVWVCEGKRPIAPLWRPDVWICNYDILGLTDTLGRPAQNSWVTYFIKLMERGDIKALVVDEGHRCNNDKAQRTVAVIEGSGALPESSPRLLLTGTPVRNGRRHELLPQLAAIGRGNEFGDKSQIKKDARLSRRMRTVCVWRPNPDAVLKRLGVLKADGTSEPIWMPVLVDGDPKVMAEYKRAEEDFMELIRDKARAKALELGEDPESAAVLAAMKAGAAASLMQVNMLCRLAGQAKIKAAREWVRDFETTGEKLLVWGENVDMMDALADRGHGLPDIPKIKGGVSHAARTKLVDGFQEEEWVRPEDHIQTLVLQIVAAGEGITLTKCYQMMFAQLAWAPGAMDQCAARAAWRMNDPHNVIAHLLVCAGTIDEQRLLVLDHKREQMALVTDGDEMNAMKEASTYGDVFGILLNKALGIKEDPK